MRERKKLKRVENSKVYSNPHVLSIGINKDQSHNLMYRAKQQDSKVIQQKKRIDKIFQCIIKERMFGKFSHRPIEKSSPNYFTINNNQRSIDQSIASRISIHRSQRFQSISNEDSYNTQKKNINKYRMIPSNSKTIEAHPSIILKSGKSQQIKIITESPNRSNSNKKSLISGNKLLTISKIAGFPKFFRKLCNNDVSMMYDLKITKQPLLERCKGIMSQEIMEKFFFFFNFPNSPISYRQYCNWVEKVANSCTRDIQLFIFRLMDQYKNGVITMTDLFQLMNYFPDNPYIEKELYEINNIITKISKESTKTKSEQNKAPTVEEVLILDHNLKLDDIKELLRQTNNDLKSLRIMKSTIYHQSILSLEHDWQERLKIDHLQNSAASNLQKKQKTQMKREGMVLDQYCKVFEGRRSRIFCQIIQLITSQKIKQYQ